MFHVFSRPCIYQVVGSVTFLLSEDTPFLPLLGSTGQDGLCKVRRGEKWPVLALMQCFQLDNIRFQCAHTVTGVSEVIFNLERNIKQDITSWGSGLEGLGVRSSFFELYVCQPPQLFNPSPNQSLFFLSDPGKPGVQ